MINKRSILACLMALLMTFLASCGEPAPPPTYSDADLQKIDQYKAGLVELRDRMEEDLETLIQKEKWIDVGTFIHGPLGDLRYKTNYLTQSLLLPKDKEPVLDAADDLFGELEELDAAASDGNYKEAVKEYAEAVRDFDTYLDLIPKPSST